LVVAYEEVDPDTGLAKNPDTEDPDWVLSSRAVLLPDQTYFSQKFSKKNHESGGSVDEITWSKIKGGKKAYEGSYYIYQFNSQGICDTPGTSFIIGSGSRNATKSGSTAPPRVTGSGKRDFGGFVIWRNGGTSVYRSPDQMGSEIKSLETGGEF
jgi:hypothetical protein